MILITNSIAHAADAVEQMHLLPPAPIYANWMFSGLVSNENGETYGYFFQMKREGDNFHAVTALFDAESKKILFSDESDATIADSTPYNWHVGRAFMRFNAINNSWIFGLKTKNNKGFNFKVDMLKRPESLAVVQSIQSGVQLLVNQATHLNGHIQTGNEKEEFVTAKNAWFRQIWFAERHESRFPFAGILCRFNDGSGFYSVKMTKKFTLNPNVSKWFDDQGASTDLSRSVRIKKDKKGDVDIYITSHNLHLALKDAIKNASVFSGFITKGKPGFCVLTEEVMAPRMIIEAKSEVFLQHPIKPGTI